MKTGFATAVVVVALLFGCAENPQEKAFYEAQKAEQDAVLVAGLVAPATISNYREVIKMNPKSKWAEKAQERIDFLTKLWQQEQLKR